MFFLFFLFFRPILHKQTLHLYTHHKKIIVCFFKQNHHVFLSKWSWSCLAGIDQITFFCVLCDDNWGWNKKNASPLNPCPMISYSQWQHPACLMHRVPNLTWNWVPGRRLHSHWAICRISWNQAQTHRLPLTRIIWIGIERWIWVTECHRHIR